MNPPKCCRWHNGIFSSNVPAAPSISFFATAKRVPVGPVEATGDESKQCGVAAAGPVADDWLMWQLADSAFPTGGFAHSGGLEAAWQHHEVRDSAGLEEFVQTSLKQLSRSLLPIMLAVYDRPDQVTESDSFCDAFLTNHVANRASRLQGRALFASAGRIFGRRAFGGMPCSGAGHLAPVFGLLAAGLKLDRAHADRLFLFWHLRGWLASAVRLGMVGPIEAQTLQVRLGQFAEELVRRPEIHSACEPVQTAPLLDLWQAAQDRMYSRLFQS